MAKRSMIIRDVSRGLIPRAIGLMGLIAWVGLAVSCSSPETGSIQKVRISGEVFQLELALDHASRKQGLSDRDHIASDGGMLFVFPTERQLSFVMRRCLVPIDILFLDGRGKVLNTHEMAVEPYETNDFQLKKYDSEGRAVFAIELSAGTIRRIGVSPRDMVEMPLIELKRKAM